MEHTLEALGGILLKAIPTVLLLLLVHFYLKRMLFRPLENVLRQRDDATAGARKLADAAFALAEQKAAEYEAAIQQARSEAFREEEALRSRWRDEENQRLEGAREQSAGMVLSARQQIESDAAVARQALAETSDQLADQIANTMLDGRRAR